jgi:putative transposase
MGLAESTYYDRLKRNKKACDPVAPIRKGRPCPGYSYTVDGQKISDEQIKEWLLELVEGEEHIYGHKLLAECLRLEKELVLNHKKCYRLCDELDILHPQRKANTKHPRKLARNHLVTGPNQLWQMDIKYGYVAGRDRFFFVLNIIDVFNRAIPGYYRGSSCEAKHVCETLKRALEANCPEGSPLPVIRTDNGPQFVSARFHECCESLQLVHERIPPKTPNMNAYIESFHSLMERELFSKEEFMTFEEAYAAVDRYMDFYNNRRMHSRLKRMSPMSFTKWVSQLDDRSKFHVSV